ncbi:hypothetical protein HAX54_011035, partial [Datura stramonium]|nr:hypothetical protein [Datura stramonium]
MANPMKQLNIGGVEEAQLAEVAKRAKIADLVSALEERNRKTPIVIMDVILYGMCSLRG